MRWPKNDHDGDDLDGGDGGHEGGHREAFVDGSDGAILDYNKKREV